MNRTFVIVTYSSLLLIACSGDPGQSGANSNQNDAGEPECGNGLIEGDEQCDNGTANADTEPDACRSTCILPSCGDGVADSDEECDDEDVKSTICSDLGYTHGRLSCTNNCLLDTSECATCGNGVAEGTEATSPGYETCDGIDLRGQDCISQGQAAGDLACDASCEWDFSGCVGGSFCGDGQLEGDEECDDGNQIACDGCSVDCVLEFCGNGISECGEECDDHNTIAGDGCSTTCRIEMCGNGILDPGEICDDGNVLSCDGCRGDCSAVETGCGDGFICGSETCDDGNTSPGDGCGPTCLVEMCGNGFVDPGETCDDGDADDCDTCHNNCTANTGCGDGVVCGTEVCDDGNTGNGDGCSADCLSDETCGNGIVDSVVGEQCDEGAGNSSLPDATCRNNCLPAGCGDNIKDSGEVCDGVDLAGQNCTHHGYASPAGLTCLSNCSGYDIAGCQAVCGNGYAETGEDCDGADLHGETCTSLGFPPGGSLACLSCSFDTSGCCQDNDGDETGENCAAGVDCDDLHAGVVGPCDGNGCPQGWALVPASTYQRGCDAGDAGMECRPDEEPRHTVTITEDFCMQTTEVSVGMYRECHDASVCGAGPTPWSLADQFCNWSSAPGSWEDHPVNCIPWAVAQTHCTDWYGGTLPTEAQWELAARGDDLRKYPWGSVAPDDPCTLCNWDVDGAWGNPVGCSGVGAGPGTWEVGSLVSGTGDSPYGLMDMAGNVYEWTMDYWSPTAYSDLCGTGCCAQPGGCDDPVTSVPVTGRAIRGGSYESPYSWHHRTVERASGAASLGDRIIGYRCIRATVP